MILKVRLPTLTGPSCMWRVGIARVNLSFLGFKETKSATMSIFRKKNIFFLNHL